MIYADYAATTPLAPEVFDKMLPYLTDTFFNPSALYPGGRAAKAGIEQAREQVAALIGADADELVFTSGGTESDNLAILGVALHPAQAKRHIITSAIEHHALLESCRWLESHGFQITYLPVDRYGRVHAADLAAAMTPDTFLVSVMWVNNELGTIQDIATLAKIAHQGGALFHTDAVQAAATQTICVQEAGVDLLSLSAHKLYGPKGCGALYIRRGVPICAMHHGGQQERFLRGGTENVPAIIGFGAAAELLQARFADNCKKLRLWKQKLLDAFSNTDGVLVNSPADCSSDAILHLAFLNVEAEGLLFWLTKSGVQVSMGSACNTQNVEPSHVVQAIDLPPAYRRGCIRLSLGCGLDDTKIDELIQKINTSLCRFR